MVTSLQVGKILLASPFLLDPYFKRSVVLLVEHNDFEGTLGFIINKTLEVSLKDVIFDFSEPYALNYGGPVAENALFYLHALGEEIEGAIKIIEGVYWGGDFEQIKEKSYYSLENPVIRFFTGYAGWSVGQLTEEMQENSWLIEDINAQEVFFEEKYKTLWQDRMKQQGNEFALWANFPDNPSLN